ncbi:SGNH/GDSL hydrolase family protein, partial [Sphaerotilus sp.]|uniref:SGNH/GDSL hydrolase family protein n=1 Tax=Sphaerotilus sp. TaxID=2093942 RepID=UPI0034E2D3D3
MTMLSTLHPVRHWRQTRWIRWIGYGLLAALTLELCARSEDLVRQGAAFWKPFSIESIFRQGEFGREGRPGAHFGKWQMNSMGFRSPEPRPGKVRVLTFGASETFGLYESPGNEYPRQLERTLQRHGMPDAEVVNIALPGLRVGHAEYLARAVQALQPTWVLIYPTPANYIEADASYCGRHVAPRAPVPEKALELRVVGKLGEQARQVVPPEVTTALKRLSIRLAERHVVPVDQLPQATLDLYRDDVECAVRTVEALGTKVVLATHATVFGPDLQPGDGQMLSAWRSYYPELREAGFLDMERRANESLRALAARRGLPLMDAAAQIPGGRRHFADFVHFTDEGARQMSDLAA